MKRRAFLKRTSIAAAALAADPETLLPAPEPDLIELMIKATRMVPPPRVIMIRTGLPQTWRKLRAGDFPNNPNPLVDEFIASKART